MNKLLASSCLFVLLIGSCTTRTQKPKAVQLSPFGTRLMIVPKGNKVGKFTVPDNGVFMTEEIFSLMIEQLKEQNEHEYSW